MIRKSEIDSHSLVSPNISHIMGRKRMDMGNGEKADLINRIGEIYPIIAESY